MKYFAVILLVCAIFAKQNAGFHLQHPEARIINGTLAELGQFPWQVSMLYRMEQGRYVCGGALIHPNFVLTAAHCVQGAIEFQLRFGSIKAWDYGVERIAKESVMNEDFNWVLHNDIGLIYVPEAVPLSDTIQPVRLPEKDEDINVNEDLIVSGFGRMATGSTDDLYYIKVKTIAKEECQKDYSYPIIDSQICCIGQNIQNTCQGDSGGPLVKITPKGATLVGITSFTHSEGCTAGKPFGFTKTSSFIDWIHNEMDKFLSRK